MVKTSNFSRLLVLALSLLVTGLQAQPAPIQSLTAFVDRTDISTNDVINLTIRVDATLGNNRPSFTGLNQGFEQVGGMSTRSTYTNNNGNIQSWTEYNITLRPLDTGELVIPSFRVAGQTTSPITIRVGDAAQVPGSNTDEIFLRTSVSKDEVYVQEQLLYTIRIYYSIGFDQGAQLSSPVVDNAVVQQLGSDENFQEVVGGIGYNVTERRFVIYPQGSGQLAIPPVYFSASVGRRGGINRLFNNRTAVREIYLTSDDHVIRVKARPTAFPAQTWLPASDLSLTESWSGNLDNVIVGDAITRNIQLTAQGLSSSLLPGINYQDLPGLRFYPDQPVREDSADRNGVTGTRSEGTAMVASRPGQFELPEVRLPWWNTDTERLEYAVLPARIINVLPAVVTDPDLAAVPPQVSGLRGGSASANSTGMATGSSSSLVWISTTVVFALAWLLTLFLWLNGRRRLAYAQIVATPQQRMAAGNAVAGAYQRNTVLPEANTALQVLKNACNSGKLHDIRKAVLKWGQARLHSDAILTLAQLSDHCAEARLDLQLRALDAALYGEDAGDFDCNSFYDSVADLHKRGPASGNQESPYSLPPLYKH